jgi:dipeptidase E
MKGKIFLAGGGSAFDSLQMDQVFASCLNLGQKILYLPIALRGIRPFDQCLSWITSAFQPLGITEIEMWTDLAEHTPDELKRYQAVYIGGGNTYSLLDQINRFGFRQPLIDYVNTGGIIYGGSAGAAILGKDIRTVTHIDHNEGGLSDFGGLDLADGNSIWVHYRAEDDPLIAAYQAETGQSILAISERAGVLVNSSGLQSIGYDPAWHLDAQGKHKIPV